jgi:hypothetical protein
MILPEFSIYPLNKGESVRRRLGRALSLAVLIALVLGGITALPAAGPSVPKQERGAKFPSDLGPATIDVSRYPAYQQESYRMFLRTCSVCHSPARAINSPLITYDNWSRYVHRMHLKAQGQLLTAEDAKRLIDFLAYDSHQRKVLHAPEFQALQRRLNARFERVHKK